VGSEDEMVKPLSTRVLTEAALFNELRVEFEEKGAVIGSLETAVDVLHERVSLV